ncbi:hypothetical protein RND81_06G073800 [Saponaria officinalis]|uniref:Myb/SANT-like domain-containing protein n=1 Tax=Saponaria officinalis TaxID=3572 RepID=A0AAW1K8V8_SAPOF
MENGKTESGRIRWCDSKTTKFIKLCIAEKASGRSKWNWNTMADTLNGITSSNFSMKQLRNHYDDLRSRYRAWDALTKWTGIAIDPVSHGVVVHNEEKWTAYVTKYKYKGSSYRKKPHANLDDLTTLFNGKSASGSCSSSPALVASLLSDDEGLGDSGAEGTDVNHIDASGDDEENMSQPSSAPNKIVNSTVFKKRKSLGGSGMSKMGHDEDWEQCVGIFKDLTSNCKRQDTSKTKFEKISEALNSIEVVKSRGHAYILRAMKFLREGDNGDFFLALSHEEQRILYLDESVYHAGESYQPIML